MTQTLTPATLAAVQSQELLRQQVAPALASHLRQIQEHLEHAVIPQTPIDELEATIRQLGSGVIAVEAPLGSGATTLLCRLAATRGWPILLPETSVRQGMELLCAQILATNDLPLAIIPPAAACDGTTLERLLAAAVAQRTTAEPYVLLVGRHEPSAVLPPIIAPAGVCVVYVCETVDDLRCAPVARVPLRYSPEFLLAVAAQAAYPPDVIELVVTKSDGSLLYLSLACDLLRYQQLPPGDLPVGLQGLYQLWWQQQSPAEQRLALVLASSPEPLPIDLAATLASLPTEDVAQYASRWTAFVALVDDHIALTHLATRRFLTTQEDERISATHAHFVGLALSLSDGNPAHLNPRTDTDLMDHLAYHAMAADRVTQRRLAAHILQRSWIVARERQTGGFRAVADDTMTILRSDVDESAAQLFRVAAISGTLESLGHALAPEAMATAVEQALARGVSKDAVLRELYRLLKQIPDNIAKAATLRRLGEVCHAHGMRASAMRMLSEALDLEVPGLARSWREEREETLVALAKAATNDGATDIALGITVRINHPERRGLIETEVVRWLLTHGALSRAEEVAVVIGHDSMHEWAMAEVAVAQARAGNDLRADEVLSTLRTETAVAWARAELACDAARQGLLYATEQVLALPVPRLRDQALALVAQALVQGQSPQAALEAIEQISDHEVRVRALIDIGLPGSSHTDTALQRATDAIPLLDDDRLPLVLALAAAWALHGDLRTALQVAALLSEGEERDRAYSRIAVALLQHGDSLAARQLADAIPDADERFWTYGALARYLVEHGRWEESLALTAQIDDPEFRSHIDAELCIIWARSGSAIEAQAWANQITLPAEQVRALIGLVEPLVQQGGVATALAMRDRITEPNLQSRYQAALAIALAAIGDRAAAEKLAATTLRPFDQARAFLGVARAADQISMASWVALRSAIRAVAPLGRSETYLLLGQAADLFGKLGGPEALLGAAHALDEIDSWWN